MEPPLPTCGTPKHSRCVECLAGHTTASPFSPRGARWRSASALLARSQRARSSGLRRTDSSAATGAYFSRELLLLSALDRHISADISGILNSRTTPYFRKNFRKDLAEPTYLKGRRLVQVSWETQQIAELLENVHVRGKRSQAVAL